MCLYAISFTVFEADLQIYRLPVLLFFTVASIIWSVAHHQECIWHVPGPLAVFPVLWVLFRRTCITVWRPL